MTPISLAGSPNLTMASAGTADRLGSDSSTTSETNGANVMNPILVQQMAQHRMDALDREAEKNRRAALVRRANGGHSVSHGRLNLAGRIRLVLQGSVA